MTPIEWSEQAIADLKSLQRYIAKDNPAAARQVAEHILDRIETVLRPNPEIGRPGRVPGTREYVVPDSEYIVPYHVRRGTIEIIRVYHGARRWPEAL
ncbi:MAG: type II toxin-antitoxin system RelE/ParE family toxin [Devosia sp.]|nr:type II toxin-antitoxin system RelE/ParE family toxin [Devosia sp.]